MQNWSNYERQVRKNFNRFMEELKIGDIITIYHGRELHFDRVKVEGMLTKNYTLPGGNKPTLHLLLRHKYAGSIDQPFDVEGSKTPWFDGPFIIHRDLEFDPQTQKWTVEEDKLATDLHISCNQASELLSKKQV